MICAQKYATISDSLFLWSFFFMKTFYTWTHIHVCYFRAELEIKWKTINWLFEVEKKNTKLTAFSVNSQGFKIKKKKIACNGNTLFASIALISEDDVDGVVDVDARMCEVDERGIDVTCRFIGNVEWIAVGAFWDNELPAFVDVWLLLRTCCKIDAVDALI